MINLLISFAVAAAVFALVGLTLGPWAAIVPALLVFLGLVFVLSRRTGKQVEAALAPVAPLLQAGQVDEARALLAAQLGLIDYLQLKFDKALPQLKRGRFRNWIAMTCIGCIHYRQGRKEEAWAEFEAAAGVQPKEAILYAVWATLAVRAGERDRALKALSRGLEAMPDSDLLKELKRTVANKKKINTRKFPDTWYQFFPEDMVRQQVMRGRRDGGLPGGQAQQVRPGAKAIYRAR